MPSTLSFSQALLQAEAQARSTLPPALHERLSAAVALVKDGRVFQASTGTWQVDSASREGMTYAVNGQCPCDDVHFNHPHGGLCKHRISVYLARRVVQLMHQPPVAPEPTPPSPVAGETAGTSHTPTGLPEAPVAVVGIDPRYVVTIQGQPFVKFAGLLTLAHQRGLQELKVRWTANDAELSLAEATAVFPFGTFEECGDASPSNVTKQVAPHFRRVACTRAAARALRLALGAEVCSVEELD